MINKSNIIASYVLVYGDLFRYLVDVKVYTLGVNTYCDLYCKVNNRYDFYSINKSLKYEPNFIRSNMTNMYFVLTFKVDTKYASLLQCYTHGDYDVITKEKVLKVIRLENKKSPATRKSSRALFCLSKVSFV
jgi:hypothetical protein